MIVLVSSNNEIITPAEDITGGTLVLNGKSYVVRTEDVDGIPENFIPEEFIFDNGTFIENPDFIAPDTIEKLRADIDYIAMETEVIL